jgi:hypothetical protein
MSKIEVFEPALCCATGLCGEDVDQQLVTFSADMDFIRNRGGDIARYNPDRTQLATRAGLDVPNGAGLGITEVTASADGCCGGASSCC